MKCEKCNTEFYLGRFCPNCGADTDEQKKDSESLIPTATYPMKWYKFLKIALWFSLILNVSQGLTNIMGMSYEGMSEAVYEAVPKLKGFDIMYGIALLCVAILNFVVWSALKEYKANAPKLLLIMYAVNIVISFAYTFILTSIVADSGVRLVYGEPYELNGRMVKPYIDLTAMVGPFNIFVTISVQVALAIYNFRYFKERDELFIH